MLLLLENTNEENMNKLFAFAKQNHLQLSLMDDVEDNILLPGKPLSPEELRQLIHKSRASEMISMENVHQAIRNKYNAG